MITSCCKEKDTVYNLCSEPELGMGDCITDSNQVKPLLLGQWNWTQTVSEAWTTYKRLGIYSINYSYHFLPNGRVNVFENGNFTSTARYTFMAELGIANSYQRYFHQRYSSYDLQPIGRSENMRQLSHNLI